MVLELLQNRTLTSLLDDVQNGQIKIPLFHREFVWDIHQSARLIESIIKGYPIGTLTFWSTQERISARRVVPYPAPQETTTNNFSELILDGQQRLVSLYASLKGIEMVNYDEKWKQFDTIFINLKAENHEPIVQVNTALYKHATHIKLYDLLKGDMTAWSSSPEKYQKKIEDYRGMIESFTFSIIKIEGITIKEAAEIFKNLNGA